MKQIKHHRILGLKIMLTLLSAILVHACNENEFVGSTPEVTTLAVSEITPKTAVSGGNVTNDGGSTVNSRGIVWNTEPNPTLEKHAGLTIETGELGLFTSSMTGLKEKTKYYVKAYASNIFGVSYGNQVAFETLEEEVVYQTGSVLDIEGNVYATVIVGRKEWMTENLRTMKYRDGTNIPTGFTNTEWPHVEGGAYTIYSHEDVDDIHSAAQMKQLYGALYNWYVINNTKGICPTGWHIPSDSEWAGLSEHLGGNSVAGGKLKSTRTAPNAHPRWSSPNTGASDKIGFSAYPAGGQGDDGPGGFGFNTSWWSSTELNQGQAWFYGVRYNQQSISRHTTSKGLGFSIRCVRNVN